MKVQKNESVEMLFIKSHPDAILPSINHKDSNVDVIDGDTGYDVYAVQDVVIPPSTMCDDGNVKVGSSLVNIGLKLGYITPGYWFKVQARSGLGFKKDIQPHYGIVDCQYRGVIGVKLYNLSSAPVKINKGDAVIQFIVYPIVRANVNFIDNPIESNRGQKGFGSSDKT